jgi:hypothetical protein
MQGNVRLPEFLHRSGWPPAGTGGGNTPSAEKLLEACVISNFELSQQKNRRSYLSRARQGPESARSVICLALISWKSTPDEPLGKNPFAQGTPAYQDWAEMNLRVKEHLALFQAEVLESTPPEDASAKDFLDYSLMVVAGTFDIFARAFLSDALASNQAAEIFEEYLTEIGKVVAANANKSRIPCISERLFSSEVRRRLHQRKQYWTGHILRTARERNEVRGAKVAVNGGDDAVPSASIVDEPKNNEERTGDIAPEPQQAASLEPPPATRDSAKTTASQNRGPKPDYETALRVTEVVKRVAGEGKWRRQLEDICIELDERAVPHPKTWNGRGYRSWLDSLSERQLAEKAITHHLEMAARRKITVS